VALPSDSPFGPVFSRAPVTRRSFKLHAARHAISTDLENSGKSLFERALVLNHAGGGVSRSDRVTAGYSHGHATDPKLSLLKEWASHIE
jgi:hypothetical protein